MDYKGGTDFEKFYEGQDTSNKHSSRCICNSISFSTELKLIVKYRRNPLINICASTTRGLAKNRAWKSHAIRYWGESIDIGSAL